MAGYVLSAAAVAKLRRALAPKAGSSSRPGAGASPVASDNFSAPFAVRWSASEASGAWVMWLPDKARCVSVAGSYITPTGITAADDLPAGWYTIDNADAQSTALYLVLTTDDSTGATTAEIDTSAGTASEGETVTNILIASLASDSETGAKRVRQFVIGTLALTPADDVEPDGVSLDYVGGTGNVQIKGWDEASPGAGKQLASILVGDDEQANQDPLDMADVPLRDPNDGSLKYAGIGTLPTDNETITLENDPQAAAANHRFTLVGYSYAAVGQIPVKRAGGLSWENPASGGADISALNGVTLVTNVEWIGYPTYAIRVTKRTCTVANNVLTLGNAQTTDIQTTPLSQE